MNAENITKAVQTADLLVQDIREWSKTAKGPEKLLAEMLMKQAAELWNALNRAEYLERNAK